MEFIKHILVKFMTIAQEIGWRKEKYFFKVVTHEVIEYYFNIYEGVLQKRLQWIILSL